MFNDALLLAVVAAMARIETDTNNAAQMNSNVSDTNQVCVLLALRIRTMLENVLITNSTHSALLCYSDKI